MAAIMIELSTMKTHIAFVRKPTARLILSGEQTCESRLSVRAHPSAYSQPGDQMLFKCGDGIALATIDQVETYSNLRPCDIDSLFDLYTRQVDGSQPDRDYWRAKQNARYAVFMHFSQVQSVHIPARLLPTTMFAWIQNYQPSSEAIRAMRESQTRLEIYPTETPIYADLLA
jgi:hypothetical protein